MAQHSVSLQPFSYMCIGRHNDYAVQQNDGRYLRRFEPVTYAVLRAHLAGTITIGTYVINEAGACRFVVFDADTDTGLLQLLDLQHQLRDQGVPSHLELSRRGGHLWLFFAAPQPAALVRRWLLPSCPSGVEFYPKQDRASWEHPGSVVRVPFGWHRLAGRSYPFAAVQDGQVVPVVHSVREGVAWLPTVGRVTLPVSILQGRTNEGRASHRQAYTAKKTSGTTQRTPPTTIREWCAQQDPLAVIGRYVELDASGMGCCPFGWHHSDGVDQHPSFKVYEPSVPGGYCWYCHVWQQGGSVFDFLQLYYQIDTRDLWHRILSGSRF